MSRIITSSESYQRTDAKRYEVLIIATPEYKDRADNRKFGVGYETSLISKAAKIAQISQILGFRKHRKEYKLLKE